MKTHQITYLRWLMTSVKLHSALWKSTSELIPPNTVQRVMDWKPVNPYCTAIAAITRYNVGKHQS